MADKLDREKGADIYDVYGDNPNGDYPGGEDEQMLAKLGLSEETSEGVVRRDLKQRHIAMIALGGTIGTYLLLPRDTGQLMFVFQVPVSLSVSEGLYRAPVLSPLFSAIASWVFSSGRS